MYQNEVRPYWLYVTKGYGYSVNDIDWSCPADLEPYAKAHEIENQEKDRVLWIAGAYTREAIMSSIGNAFIDKGQKEHEYPDSPVSEKNNSPKYDENGEMILTEEEKKMWRERLLIGLQIKQSNFEASKRDGGTV